MGNGGVFPSAEEPDMKLMLLHRGSRLRMIRNTDAFTLYIAFAV
jgi:hypothetical protein